MALFAPSFGDRFPDEPGKRLEDLLRSKAAT